MDGMDPSFQAPVLLDPPAEGRQAGVFLHSGWRSCGTWMWERLRESSGVRGFYEPLHEDLATLKQRDVGLLRPDSWRSGHGSGAPYFAEFSPLLGRRGGVEGHQARFAFDDFFAGPETHDPALEGYIRGLMAGAAAEHRTPVMKFCRSLGRVAWMEARFPDVLHAVILRDPAAQWRSARRQMEQNRNRYFVLAPFVILARNADNPLLADAVTHLGVKMPPLLSRNLGVTTDSCWRHVQRLDWRDRFRGFLALWTASGIAALSGQAMLIDADRLATDATARGDAERAIAGAAGVPVDLMPGPPADATRVSSPAEKQDAARARVAALAFLDARGQALAPSRRTNLAAKLAAYDPVDSSAADTRRPRAQQPSVADYVDAAAYVAMARATYPLRRAHYHVRRWLDGG